MKIKKMESAKTKMIYKRWARVYDAVFRRFFQPRIQHVINNVEIKSGQCILEIGVGTGLALPCYPKNCEVIGIDISLDMLQQAREKALPLAQAKITLLEMDAAQLSFPNNTFDHVFAPFVMTVVEHADSVMAELIRVVKPGGKIIFLNHFQSDHATIAFFEKCFNPISRRLGWRMDLKISDLVTAANSHATLEKIYKIHPYDLWKIAIFRCLQKDA